MRHHQRSPLGWDWEKVWPEFRVKPPSSSSLAPHFQSLPRATRLFCDVYNPQRERHCKQLQVLGPEHSRCFINLHSSTSPCQTSPPSLLSFLFDLFLLVHPSYLITLFPTSQLNFFLHPPCLIIPSLLPSSLPSNH